jgi:hypothetical protein
MSKGNDSRTGKGQEAAGRTNRGSRGQQPSRSSRSSVKMTAERARAIQAHADRANRNQDFKARAMSAAAKNESDDD